MLKNLLRTKRFQNNYSVDSTKLIGPEEAGQRDVHYRHSISRKQRSKILEYGKPLYGFIMTEAITKKASELDRDGYSDPLLSQQLNTKISIGYQTKVYLPTMKRGGFAHTPEEVTSLTPEEIKLNSQYLFNCNVSILHFGSNNPVEIGKVAQVIFRDENTEVGLIVSVMDSPSGLLSFIARWAGGSTSTGGFTPRIEADTTDADIPEQINDPPPNQSYWTLIAAVAVEADPRNDIDLAYTAQSIFNRVYYNKRYGGFGPAKDNTNIVTILTQKGQYQALFRDSSGVVAQPWKSITDRQGVIVALRSSTNSLRGASESAINNRIDKVIRILSSSANMNNARTFVGAKTDFLAYPREDGTARKCEVHSPGGGNYYHFINNSRIYNILSNPCGTPGAEIPEELRQYIGSQ